VGGWSDEEDVLRKGGEREVGGRWMEWRREGVERVGGDDCESDVDRDSNQHIPHHQISSTAPILLAHISLNSHSIQSRYRFQGKMHDW
jgi:hypothetical protein